jgi:pentapeptide MXKDX repeat protein
MTVSTQIALGISATVLSLSLALATAAFAGDPMTRDVEFRNSLAKDSGMKNDAIKGAMRKNDGMKKDGLLK